MSQQTILITGATAGFGWACAERFAKEGWKLIIAGRRQERLDNLAKQLAPAPTHSVVLDVRDAASIKAMLAALPEELRTAIMLRELDGLSYEEIANIMECPIGTVRSRIFRAREAIAERLRPLLDTAPDKRW